MPAVRIPRAQTLARYGLTHEAWGAMLARQGGVCALCGRLPDSGRLCIDHEHVKGFKRLPDAARAACVRGLICFRCNRYKVAANDVASAEAVVAYLWDYVRRRAATKGEGPRRVA